MPEKNPTDAEVLASKQAAATAPRTPSAAREQAAVQRADYLRALEEERDMCERSKKADRVKAIDAEIKRVKSVKDRSAEAKSEA